MPVTVENEPMGALPASITESFTQPVASSLLGASVADAPGQNGGQDTAAPNPEASCAPDAPGANSAGAASNTSCRFILDGLNTCMGNGPHTDLSSRLQSTAVGGVRNRSADPSSETHHTVHDTLLTRTIVAAEKTGCPSGASRVTFVAPDSVIRKVLLVRGSELNARRVPTSAAVGEENDAFN